MENEMTEIEQRIKSISVNIRKKVMKLPSWSLDVDSQQAMSVESHVEKILSSEIVPMIKGLQSDLDVLQSTAREYQAYKHGDRLYYDDRERKLDMTWERYTKELQATGNCKHCGEKMKFKSGGYIPPLCTNPKCVSLRLRMLTSPNLDILRGEPTDNETGDHNRGGD